MLTVDIYFLLSNQSARKVLFTCLGNTKDLYHRVFRVTPQTANSKESRDLVLAVTFAVSGSRLNLGSTSLRYVPDLRERFIARNLSEVTFEPNSYISLCVNSFVNTISLIKSRFLRNLIRLN